MTVGFQSWGANGSFLQIDSNYRNQRLTQQGQALTNYVWGTGFYNNTTNGTYTAVDVEIRGDYPIVAIRCGTTTAMMTKLKSPGIWTYTFIAAGGGNTPIDYWVFNELLPQPSNIGLQIFKQDGTVVFDSSDRPSRVMDFAQLGALGGAANYQEELVRDFGRGNWAVCQTAFSTQTIYETAGLRRALLQSVGVITRGGQLWRCRSISAMYNPGAGWGSMGSSSYYSMAYITIDLDSL